MRHGEPARVGHLLVLSCVLLYSTTLGITAVAYPLRALEAGYGPAAVGYLGAYGAASQLASRALLPQALRRVPDRWLLLTACGLMVGSAGSLALWTELPAFVASATLLGASRALFWTGGQVYVLYGDIARGQRQLSHLQVMSGAGEFIGPLVGGLAAEWALEASLWLCVVLVIIAFAVATSLDRHPPLGRVDKQQVTPVWRHRDVAIGSAAVATAGGWRGLLSSVVPAVLAEVGRSAGQIGLLLAVANGMSMVGSLIAGRLSARWIGVTAYLGIIATGLTLGVAGLAGGSLALAGAMLAISGLGNGLLQTLGTVLAAAAVHKDQRGDVVVLTGLVRSGALLVLPAGVAVLVGVMAAPFALAVGGGMLTLPIAVGLRTRR